MLRSKSGRETQTFDCSEAITPRRMVKINSTDETKIDVCDTAGEVAVGAIPFDPSRSAYAIGDRVAVVTRGEVDLEAGATVAAGVRVTTAADGRVITAASGHNVCGVSRSGGDAGDLITVDLAPGSLLA